MTTIVADARGVTAGRTVWWPKDSAWWRREYIVALLEEFGPGGPAVIDWLSCEAKAQNEGGWVKAGVRTVARGCGVDVVTVGHVLSRSVTLGALDDLDEENGRFVCRISGWAQDNQRAHAAVRKAAQRQKPATSHASSRPVPECPPTGEDRREEKTPSSQPPTSSELDAAREARGLFAYWQERCSHETAKPTAERLKKVQARLKEGYTPEQVRLAIDGAARAPFVNDAGKVFDDLELICRNGSKLEDFIARAHGPVVHAPAVNGYEHPADRRDRELAGLAEQLRAREAS